MAESTHPPKLTATYIHPASHPSTAPQIFSKELPPPPTPQISTSHSLHTHNDPSETSKPEALHTAPSASATRAHLNALRAAVREVQTELNTFLTARMEEEKATSAGKGVDKSAEDMERDGEVEEEMDDETKKLEQEVERLRQEEQAEGKGKGKKRKKEKE